MDLARGFFLFLFLLPIFASSARVSTMRVEALSAGLMWALFLLFCLSNGVPGELSCKRGFSRVMAFWGEMTRSHAFSRGFSTS